MTKIFPSKGNSEESISVSINGVEFFASGQDQIYGFEFWEKVNAGRYEPDTFAFLKASVTTKTLFIDIGAAVGAMTLFMGKLGAQVISLEPHPKIFDILGENLGLNPNLRNSVTIMRAALGVDNITMIRGELDPSLLTPIVFTNSSRNEFGDVKVITLPTILQNFPPDTRRVIAKMDIEGAEWKIFESKEFLDCCNHYEITVLLAVHPGLDKPYTDHTNALFHFLILSRWRIRNIFQLFTFFKRSSGSFRVYRTNYQEVSKFYMFLLLCMGGYHEYILDFTKKSQISR